MHFRALGAEAAAIVCEVVERARRAVELVQAELTSDSVSA